MVYKAGDKVVIKENGKVDKIISSAKTKYGTFYQVSSGHYFSDDEIAPVKSAEHATREKMFGRVFDGDAKKKERTLFSLDIDVDDEGASAEVNGIFLYAPVTKFHNIEGATNHLLAAVEKML